METNGSNDIIFTGDQLCPELRESQKCFRCLGYSEGNISEVLHEHIPSRRISQDAGLEALRALAGHSARWSPLSILRSSLNDRPGDPLHHPTFNTDVSYPEPGVIRYTVSAGDGWAWIDEVIAPDSFRKGTAAKASSA